MFTAAYNEGQIYTASGIPLWKIKTTKSVADIFAANMCLTRREISGGYDYNARTDETDIDRGYDYIGGRYYVKHYSYDKTSYGTSERAGLFA